MPEQFCHVHLREQLLHKALLRMHTDTPMFVLNCPWDVDTRLNIRDVMFIYKLYIYIEITAITLYIYTHESLRAVIQTFPQKQCSWGKNTVDLKLRSGKRSLEGVTKHWPWKMLVMQQPGSSCYPSWTKISWSTCAQPERLISHFESCCPRFARGLHTLAIGHQ